MTDSGVEHDWEPYGWWAGPCGDCGGPTIESWSRLDGRWAFEAVSCYGECPAVVGRKFRAGLLAGQSRSSAA